MSQKRRTGAGEITVGHAITLTGYRQPGRVTNVPLTFEQVAPLPMKSGAIEVVYAHDDNLGSHAHYELFDSTERNPDGHELLRLRRGGEGRSDHPWWTPDEWTVTAALVPKPDKLRLPVTAPFLT